MIIASGIFCALVIIPPAIWEYCLPAKTKAGIAKKVETWPLIGSKRSRVEKSKQSGSSLVLLTSNGNGDDRRNGKDVNASEEVSNGGKGW